MARRLFPAEVRRWLPAIQFGVLDTNVILKNIGRDVRDHPMPTRMRLVSEFGALRMFVGSHVLDEVEEKLDIWMVERGRDAKLARRIWEQDYLPRLWVVDPGPPIDERLAGLMVRDPDDVPTGMLALLLGRKALSEDRDLAEDGLATGDPWLEVLIASGSVALGDTVNFGVLVGASASAQGLVGAAGAVRKMAETPDGRQFLLIIGFGLLLVLGGTLLLRQLHEPSRQWIDENAGAAWKSIRSGGEVTVGGYFNVLQNRRRAEVVLEAGVVASATTPTDIQVAARLLAGAEAPVPTDQLVRVVWGYQQASRAACGRMRSLLCTSPAFVEIGQGRWQLGRRAA